MLLYIEMICFLKGRILQHLDNCQVLTADPIKRFGLSKVDQSTTKARSYVQIIIDDSVWNDPAVCAPTHIIDDKHQSTAINIIIII